MVLAGRVVYWQTHHLCLVSLEVLKILVLLNLLSFQILLLALSFSVSFEVISLLPL